MNLPEFRYDVEPLLIVDEVSMITRLPKATVYEYARTGLLPCVRFGRSIRFKKSDIQDFINTGGKSFEGGWRKEAA